MEAHTAVYVIDTSEPEPPWPSWCPRDEGRKPVARISRSEPTEFVRLEWLDQTTLAIEYPAGFDHASRGHPSSFILRDDGAWRGLQFLFRPIPEYAIVVQNQRRERITQVFREGMVIGTPYDWVDACSQLRLTWLTWEFPGRRLSVTFQDAQGKLLLSLGLRGEILGDTLLVKDQEDTVVASTHLSPPIEPSLAGEIRWVIPPEPGKECR